MKPNEARAMRRRQDAAREARGEKLEAFLQSGGDADQVRPELIPTEEDYLAARRAFNELVSRANRTPQGTRRRRVLDELIVAGGRLLYVERVRLLPHLERAALTPAQLAVLARVPVGEVRVAMDRWMGRSESRVVLPS